MIEKLGTWHRTHMCGELDTTHEGQEVLLMGWVQKRRDLGGLIFIDLRDRSGLIQCNLSPHLPASIFAKGEGVRGEYVLAIQGTVQRRPQGQVNKQMATGEIEIAVKDLKLLNTALTPPFYIVPDVDTDEALRLKYRYLDLRRADLQFTLMMRHRLAMSVRKYLDTQGFLEMETPILTKSTPEGARDYLVPSRVNPGSFYALPQSPQIFKQLLMVAGYDRYFQIVKCFRDEDLRADRQPEFTQVDIEMSFVNEMDVRQTAERLVRHVFLDTLDVTLDPAPFPQLTYQEAMTRFGSDKPDCRFAMELRDLSLVVAKSQFNVFSKTVAEGGAVLAISVPQGGTFSRKEIDNLSEIAKKYGAQGLAWMAIQAEEVRSPIAKFLSSTEINHIQETLQSVPGDLVLMVAAQREVAQRSLGALRLHLGRELKLIDKHQWNFLWVIDFPMFEYDEEAQRYVAVHHPFTMPHDADLHLLQSDPLKIRAQAYDLVLNGAELAGGSIRVHEETTQMAIFNALGLTDSQVKEKFGFLLEAMRYGAPPHGGIAFGFDRLVMEVTGRSNIRDVIAFPKTTSASCLLSEAPSAVTAAQLAELKLKIDEVGGS